MINVSYDYVDEFTRSLPYKNTTALIKRDGIYGMWRLQFTEGELPVKLKDARYTTPELAAKAVKIHEAQSSNATSNKK